MIFRFFKGGWLSRIIIIGIVLAELSLGGLAVYLYLSYQRAESALVVERDQQVTYLAAFRLQSELLKYVQPLEDLSQTSAIQTLTSGSANKAFSQIDYQLADFDGGVVLFDQTGKVITSIPTRPEIIGQDWSNRDYFREVKNTNKIAYSNAVNDGQNGASVVVLCIPIRDQNGQFIGMLGGMFRLGQTTVSSLYASIIRLRLGQSGTTYVIDGNKKVLYDSESKLIGEIYNNQLLKISPDQPSGAQRMIDQTQHDIVASYAVIPDTPWILVVEDDWNILINPVQTYVYWLLLIGILAIIIPSVGIRVLYFLQNKENQQKTSFEREMQVARQIKERLLPKQIPIYPGWNLSVHHQTTHTVSGDYYDFMFLSDGRLMFSVGEVADQGLQAMVKMATLRASIRGAGQRLLAPAEALKISNTLICPEVGNGRSIKCLYGIIDFASGTIQYASAGNHEAYLVDGMGVGVLSETGEPLGNNLETEYEQKQMTLKEGETILICSDGVLNVHNQSGEPFGAERLRELLTSNVDDHDLLVERILTSLRSYSGKKWKPDDDITIVHIERMAENQ